MHLTDLITDDDPDVIAITETWLDNTVNNTEFTPDGYTAFRKDRDINHYNPGTYTQNERGGVLLLVKKILNPVIYTEASCGWWGFVTDPRLMSSLCSTKYVTQ